MFQVEKNVYYDHKSPDDLDSNIEASTCASDKKLFGIARVDSLEMKD